MTPLLTPQDHNLAGLTLLKSSSKCLLNGWKAAGISEVLEHARIQGNVSSLDPFTEQ